MRRYIVLASLLGFGLTFCSEKRTAADGVQNYLTEEVLQLRRTTKAMIGFAEHGDYNALRKQFDEARKIYKHIEPITEFYFPFVSKVINGPAIDKVDEHDEKLIECSGFQVVEELIFPADAQPEEYELIAHLRILDASVNRLEKLIAGTRLTDDNIFEAIRLHLLRIGSLGISGFDSPVHLNSIKEASASLDGVEAVLRCYASRSTTPHAFESVIGQLHKGQTFTSGDMPFERFDRAAFIVNVLKPLAKSIYGLQKELAIPNNPRHHAMQMDQTEWFDVGAFDDTFFSPAYALPVKEERVQLGKTLFFDPVLSGNNARSCASCHIPAYGFADKKTKSKAFNMTGEATRHTPTLINSVFQKSQFWDSRVMFVEDQVHDVISNPNEMQGNFNHALAALLTSDEYIALFNDAFPGIGRDITEQHIRIALAAFVRSLKGMNARFDQYMKGDHEALSPDEIAGFNLFMGKAKCGTCHFMPLFNGTVPPFFKETESEVLGVPARAVTNNASVDPDPGRYGRYSHPLLRHMFKTPTVRNAAITGPYMHNGVYETLEQVMDFYNRGGGAGIGAHLTNQTLPAEKLDLTEQEQRQVIAFIHSLTDTTGLTAVPSRLPELGDPKTNQRRIGGEY